jgi:serine/threonine-protein kinase
MAVEEGPIVSREAFGDFELIERVAAGGMGEVFLARQHTIADVERYLAIKRMLPELSRDEEAVQMFLDEARLASRLVHQNVVQIFDLGSSDDRYYLAMEFLEGRDMKRIMGRLSSFRWPLPFAFAAKIVSEAAKGLHYAHELVDNEGLNLKVIHRDISPQNIFVTVHGTIKVLDFGIAKARSQLVKTRDGIMKGKVAYIAPERIVGQAGDRRVDIFSLGVVLWELTIGKRLFKRTGDVKTLMAIVANEVPRPTQMTAEVPEKLEEIILRCLEPNPDERYPTCRDLQDDLETFMASAGYVVTPRRLGHLISMLFEDEPTTIRELVSREGEAQ